MGVLKDQQGTDKTIPDWAATNQGSVTRVL
jgi:hypothetical protein